MRDFILIFIAVVLARMLTFSFEVRNDEPLSANLTAVTNTIYIVEVHEETLMGMMEANQ